MNYMTIKHMKEVKFMYESERLHALSCSAMWLHESLSQATYRLVP